MGGGPKVLHVSQPVDAGVAAVVQAQVVDQRKRGWDVVVACPDGELPDELRTEGVRVERWPAGRAPDHHIPAEARALRAVLDRVRPDVVHLHSSKAGSVGRMLLRGAVPTIFQPHGWSFDAVRGAASRAALRWERFGARWTDRLVCVSADELAAGRAARIGGAATVVPNGVDVEALRPVDRAAARRAVNLPPGPLAVCVGRVAEQKGQDYLLQAWPSVRHRQPAAQLALVGGGPAAQTWQRRFADVGQGSVHWIGSVGDAHPYYSAADVVAVPSRWEGMALVPLEAMASGRSVVAFDVAGIRESLGSRCGAVLPRGDVHALADALTRRLAEPALAAAEGEQGRLRAVERFDRGRATDDVAGIVAELLDLRTAMSR